MSTVTIKNSNGRASLAPLAKNPVRIYMNYNELEYARNWDQNLIRNPIRSDKNLIGFLQES